MRAAECTTWEAVFEQTPDPRARRGRRYHWATLLALICAALLSGQQQGAAIAQWVREHASAWQAWAPTTRGRIPSAATLRRVLRLLDPQTLDQALGAWAMCQLPPTQGQIGAVSGPTSGAQRGQASCRYGRSRWLAKPYAAPRRLARRCIWSAW